MARARSGAPGLWQRLSPRDRACIQIIIVTLMLAGYAIFVYPASHRRLQDAQTRIVRLRQDIAQQSVDENSADAKDSPRQVEEQISEADKRLKELSATFNELDSGFAPLESDAERQQLMLEISTLAQRTGIELLRVSRKGLSSGEGPSPPAPVDPTLGRPLLVVEARAQYHHLLRFLEGLKDLSFYVSVMNLKLYSSQLGTAARQDATQEGQLQILLELSM